MWEIIALTPLVALWAALAAVEINKIRVLLRAEREARRSAR